jgi:hypothetical protein
MEKKQKNFPQYCLVCQDLIDRTVKGNKYIFPVPPKYGLRYNEGAYACPVDAPTVQSEQRAEGHLEMVHRTVGN